MTASTDARTLLLASTGGHLEELARLWPRFQPAPAEVVWATFDSPQSRSLLADQHVEFIRPVAPREARAAARSVPEARRFLRKHGITQVVSTGSAVAVPWLTAARALRLPAHYIESAARGDGPSLSGRMLMTVPGVHLYCQSPAWADRRWSFRGSLFDSYLSAVAPADREPSVRRVVVTLGTLGFGFRRAVEALVPAIAEVAAPDADVLWQTGATDVSGLGITAHDRVPSHDLQSAIEEADLVVAHAGVGSSLVALDAGHCPVVIPRLKAHNEHVDDHQTMLSSELSRRGLAVAATPESITAATLSEAARRAVSGNADAAPYRLD
ncbi:glycosyltransferase [Actinomycetota bacterium]